MYKARPVSKHSKDEAQLGSYLTTGPQMLPEVKYRSYKFALPVEDDEDLSTSLSKYLLKTLCSEMFNATLTSLADDHMISVGDNALESVEV